MVVAQRDSGKVAGHLYGVGPGCIVRMNGIALVYRDRPVTPVDDVATGCSAHRDGNRVARRGRFPSGDKSVLDIGHNRTARAVLRGFLNYDQSQHPRVNRTVVRVFACLLKYMRELFPGRHHAAVKHPVAPFGKHSAGNCVRCRVLVGPCDFTAHIYGDRMRNEALVGRLAAGHRRALGIDDLGAGIGGECSVGCRHTSNGPQQHKYCYCHYAPQQNEPNHYLYKNMLKEGSSRKAG